MFLDTLIYSIIIPLMPSLVASYGGAKEIGIIAAMYSLGGILGAPIFGFMSDRLGNRKIPMLIGLVLSMVSMVLLIFFSKSLLGLIIIRICQGLCGGLIYTVGLAM